MSITAKELAKQLGLSPSAVSIALNNKPGISTETRKKILDAARVSNYDFSKIGEKKTTAGTIYFLIYILLYLSLVTGILGCKGMD